MKQKTLEILESDLRSEANTKRTQRNIERLGYTYEIEYIPVLVERTKEGRVGEMTFPENRLIYYNENE